MHELFAPSGSILYVGELDSVFYIRRWRTPTIHTGSEVDAYQNHLRVGAHFKYLIYRITIITILAVAYKPNILILNYLRWRNGELGFNIFYRQYLEDRITAQQNK